MRVCVCERERVRVVWFLGCEFMLCILFRLLSIAEETLAEFLSKATGTAVEWVQMPGMKVFLDFSSFFFNKNNRRFSLNYY